MLTYLNISPDSQAVTLSLGSLPLTEPTTTSTATYEQIDTSASETIDGIFGTVGILNGWGIADETDMSHMIQWTWQNDPIPQPTLAPGQSVAYYTYTLHLNFGYGNQHSLRTYSLLANDHPDNNDLLVVKDYQSVSNKESNTISVDTTHGIITTTRPSVIGHLDTHTLVFRTRSNQLIDHLAISLQATPGWGDNGNFILSEITGSLSAEIVPEPATYALLLGCITAFGIALRNFNANTNTKTHKKTHTKTKTIPQ